ncbi:MAG: deoxyhypusine synthase family protein [Candidatus Woesearchaeota archaeon]
MTRQNKEGYIPSETANLSKLPSIKGYNYEKAFDLVDFIKAYGTTGIQASHLASGVEILKAMRRENATIFLSYTSNMVSSGVREALCYLVKHKLVHALITPAGGIEEDFLKCFGSFRLGNFSTNGKHLFESGVNRIGNIFVTNDFYAYFEKAFHTILDECGDSDTPPSVTDITRAMGLYTAKLENYEDSILYWAAKNDIPVFSPAFTDGSIGDIIYFHRQKKKDFFVDIAQDMDLIVNLALNAHRTGIVALGGGSAKHYALNAQIFREGCDFAVFVNTHDGEDASDSGANPSEAITWAKLKPDAPHVKIISDASIVFPLLVAAGFKEARE